MRWITLAIAVTAAACSGGGGGDVGPDADIGCRFDHRAMTYAAGMKLAGDSGALSFAIETATPAPPLKGNNSWTVQILDGSGAPVTGATMTAVPFMPDHGHGTQVTPVVTPAGDAYTVAPLYLFMPGLWQVTLTATSAAGDDSVKFDFCIEG
jgi:hypothetical protein